jgi:hypothetical protein
MTTNENFSMETVRLLVSGSAEIDRMKRESVQVVSMVLGLIKPGIQNDGFQLRDESVSPSWLVTGYSSSAVKGHTFVMTASCFFMIDTEVSEDRRKTLFDYVVGYPTTTSEFRGGDVRELYNSLPSFLELVVRNFPSVKDRMQPFLDAAA